MNIARSLVTSLVLSAAFTAPASAVLITGTDDDFSYTFAQFVGGVTVSGSVNVNITEFNTSSDHLHMLVTLTNTTPGPTPGQNRFTAWGFGIAPNPNGGSWSDSNDGGMVLATFGDLPGLPLIEVCVYSFQNCNAGAAGLLEGQSDTFGLRLNFANLTSAGATFDPFGARFVSVGPNEGSYTFYTPPVTTVPEPATLSMLGAGLLLLGFARRKKIRA